MNIQYNFNDEIHYTNNFTYRNTIRQLFTMICSPNPELDHMDEESRDELTYNEEDISISLSQLYEYTKDNELFQQLYDLAAARMFSTDREIGQCVLFSYDYLMFFHYCLASFHRGDFNKDNKHYLLLIQKLT